MRGVSLGLLVPAATVSCSSVTAYRLRNCSYFFLSLTLVFNCKSALCDFSLSFRLSAASFCLNWCESALFGLFFLFARSRSAKCFPRVFVFYLSPVSLLLACPNILACWNLPNRNSKSALLGLFFLFARSRLPNCFRPFLYSIFLLFSCHSLFSVLFFIHCCCPEIEM